MVVHGAKSAKGDASIAEMSDIARLLVDLSLPPVSAGASHASADIERCVAAASALGDMARSRQSLAFERSFLSFSSCSK